MSAEQEDRIRFVGWRVSGWTYPVVWWARRKPSSNFRQRVWDVRDAYVWRQTLRKWRRLKAQRTDPGVR